MQFASFLKPLLYRSTPEAAGSVQPEPATPPDSGLNREMPVEIMRDFDTVLLFGRLAEAGPGRLKIERAQDGARFPILDEGSMVLVRGYDGQMAPIILRAVVVSSSGFRCTVDQLEQICHETGRKLVRYPVCPPGTVQILDDAALERPQPCQLLNLSTGGACIVSEQVYTSGQSLRIRIGRLEDSAAYFCQVVRATPRRGGFFEYGLRFVHLGKEQRGRLAREIRSIQEETGEKLHVDKYHTGLPNKNGSEHR